MTGILRLAVLIGIGVLMASGENAAGSWQDPPEADQVQPAPGLPDALAQQLEANRWLRQRGVRSGLERPAILDQEIAFSSEAERRQFFFSLWDQSIADRAAPPLDANAPVVRADQLRLDPATDTLEASGGVVITIPKEDGSTLTIRGDRMTIDE